MGVKVDWNDKWIAENYLCYSSYSDMAVAYNKLFCANVSVSGIKAHARKIGIKKPMWYEPFTEEQKAFILKWYPELGVKETTKMFNEQFCMNKSRKSIKNFAYSRKVHVKHSVATKNKRAVHENGYGNRAVVPLGTIREECGRPVIKTEHGWTSYGRAMYDGCIPDGYVVTHLDGDLYNVNKDNLVAVPVCYMGLLQRNNLRSSNAEVTKTGIKWCDLYVALERGNC